MLWFHKKRQNKPVQNYPDIDVESIGILKSADEIKLDKIISGADDDIRRNVWAEISRKMEKVHVGCDIEIWSETYRKIPYKILVDTLQQAGYILRNGRGRYFDEYSYTIGMDLYISIPYDK